MCDDTKQSTLFGAETTIVVNRKKNPFTVDIGRPDRNIHMNNTEVGEPGWLGNPYPKDEYGREICIEMFREDFEERIEEDDEFREAVEDLQGEVLGCYCKPAACHGDVILEYIKEASMESNSVHEQTGATAESDS